MSTRIYSSLLSIERAHYVATFNVGDKGENGTKRPNDSTHRAHTAHTPTTESEPPAISAHFLNLVLLISFIISSCLQNGVFTVNCSSRIPGCVEFKLCKMDACRWRSAKRAKKWGKINFARLSHRIDLFHEPTDRKRFDQLKCRRLFLLLRFVVCSPVTAVFRKSCAFN